MKTNKILLGLITMISLTGCWLGVDYFDMQPTFYIVNQSNESVYLTYTLQQSIAEQVHNLRDTIEINVNDTAIIDLYGKIESDYRCKPNHVLCTMKFTTKSGTTIKEMKKINNDDWQVFPIKEKPDKAVWLYIFAK